jgi:hypothetical protein
MGACAQMNGEVAVKEASIADAKTCAQQLSQKLDILEGEDAAEATLLQDALNRVMESARRHSSLKADLAASQAEAARRLSHVQVPLDAALSLLAALEYPSLVEIRRYQRPPPHIFQLLFGVALALNSPGDWAHIKGLLNEAAVLGHLKQLHLRVVKAVPLLLLLVAALPCHCTAGRCLCPLFPPPLSSQPYSHLPLPRPFPTRPSP